MVVKSTKLRKMAIGTQLIAGFGLLTASYMTTESGWSQELINAAVHSEQPTIKAALNTIKFGRC